MRVERSARGDLGLDLVVDAHRQDLLADQLVGARVGAHLDDLGGARLADLRQLVEVGGGGGVDVGHRHRGHRGGGCHRHGGAGAHASRGLAAGGGHGGRASGRHRAARGGNRGVGGRSAAGVHRGGDQAVGRGAYAGGCGGRLGEGGAGDHRAAEQGDAELLERHVGASLWVVLASRNDVVPYSVSLARPARRDNDRFAAGVCLTRA